MAYTATLGRFLDSAIPPYLSGLNIVGSSQSLGSL